MTDTVIARSWVRSANAVPLALIALVSVASRQVWIGDPVSDADEQLYSLIGARLLDGHLPYIDVWDRKPLGLFLLYALAHAIGGPGPAAYQALAALFVVAGGWCVYALARPLTDRWTACGTALLYPLLAYAYGCFSGQSEVLFIPLVLGMVLLVRDLAVASADRNAALAMLLGGLALQIKYTVAPQCAVLGLVALWHFRGEGGGRLMLRAAAFALIGLLPTALAGLFYAAQGEFDAFYFANFISVFQRLPAGIGRFDSRVLTPVLPLMLLAAGGIYTALRRTTLVRPGHYRLIGLWSASVLAGIFIPGTVYIYYFAAFVPCAVLLAVPLLNVRGPLKWVPLALVLAAGAAMLNIPRHLAETRRDRAELAALVARLAPYVGQTRQCLLVYDGPTALYRLTHSCLPGHYLYPDHLNNALETQALGINQTAEVSRLLAARPGAIVTADEPVTEQNLAAGALVAEAIRRHYRPLGTAVLRGSRYRAWGLITTE